MSRYYVPSESLLDSRVFRKLLAFSLAGHVALFLVLTFRPRSQALLISPTPVMVNMVDMPRAAPARPAKPLPAKPLPKEPEAVPEPPKPKPVVNEVVIPKEPKPLPVKPKPAPKPVEKPEPAKSAEQILAELTAKVDANNPPIPEAPPQPAPAAPSLGGAGTFDPLLSPWVARVNALVRANWSGAQLCKADPCFDVDIEANGALEALALEKSSGDRYCDESAERAVRKSNPLPVPPRGAMQILLCLNLKDRRQ